MPQHVCYLHQAIYGLKLVSPTWLECFCSVMLQSGFFLWWSWLFIVCYMWKIWLLLAMILRAFSLWSLIFSDFFRRGTWETYDTFLVWRLLRALAAYFYLNRSAQWISMLVLLFHILELWKPLTTECVASYWWLLPYPTRYMQIACQLIYLYMVLLMLSVLWGRHCPFPCTLWYTSKDSLLIAWNGTYLLFLP